MAQAGKRIDREVWLMALDGGQEETVRNFVDDEINSYVDEWEKEGIFPAHTLFKKMGDLGLLGIHKPEAYGGIGLDYSYQVVFAEELGTINCGGVPMVSTSYASPRRQKLAILSTQKWKPFNWMPRTIT